MPGVARLLDDGGDGESVWLVMERIHGAPFPGRRAGRNTPCEWEDLRGVTLALLETLVHVHGAGVTHRDLKPENVLVAESDQPVLGDFGIASTVEAFERGVTTAREVRGTPEHMAPELLHGGGDARSDLYALGVMLVRALTCESPFLPDGSPRPLGAGVPAHVAATCARLLATRPDARPASAREVLGALGDGVPPPPISRHGMDLVDRFAGPERLLHLPSDAASIARARAGSDPARLEADRKSVEAELTRWVRARLAVLEGERLRVTRAALDSLAEPSRGKRRETPRAWIARARRHAQEGRHALAEPLLRDALRSAAAPPRDERTLLAAARLWVRLVVAARDRSLTARFLYELSRIDPKEPALDAIEALARAFDGALHWTPEALHRARAVPALGDRELEVLRFGARVFAARKVSLEALRDEAGLLARASRSKHASWEEARAIAHGRLLYVEERYADAARCYERAAERASWKAARLAGLLNAASAWMEAFDFGRAMKIADDARREAQGARLAFFEGRAEWIGRSAADRARVELAPDLALVEAARHLDAPDLVLLIAVTESTLAFRKQDRVAFARLAAMAREACGLDNEQLGMATIDAMEIALGVRAAAERDLALADRLAARGVPRLALEVAALIEGRSPRSPERAAWLRELAGAVPPHLHDRRLGVLSVGEALATLGLS